MRKALSFRALVAPREGLRLQGLPVSACGWLAAELAAERQTPVVLVVPKHSEGIAAAAAASLGGTSLQAVPVAHDSALALTPYQEADPPLRGLAQQAQALEYLRSKCPALIVADATSLMRPITDVESWGRRRRDIHVGSEVDRDELLAGLVEAGFDRVETVSQVGEFAVRGAVVDCFSAGAKSAVRVEFWGDEVTSLRSFGVRDQLTRSSLQSFTILPLTPFAAGRKAARDLATALAEHRTTLGSDEAERRIKALAAGGFPPGWMHWLPLLETRIFSLGDWVEPRDLILWDAAGFEQELDQHAERLRQDREVFAHRVGLDLPTAELIPDRKALREHIAEAHLSVSVWVDGAEGEAIDFGAKESETARDNPERFAQICERAGERGNQIVLAHANDGRIARRFLSEYGLSDRVELAPGELISGFVLPAAQLAVFAESQLYAVPGQRGGRRVSRKRHPREAFVGGLKDLKPGDCVVHEEHGIGRYVGLRRVGSGAEVPTDLPDWALEHRPSSGSEEVLEIAYRDGRTLLLPVERIGLLSRYGGLAGAEPRLDRLGGTSWQARRDRARSSVRKLAVDLLDLYAKRRLARATPMPADGPLLAEFSRAFSFVETRDQERAIHDVQQDLTRTQPMDRLLCGDVGFGKTEVAMRAAMQAVEAGCQVAVLAPTTILADQHLTSFRRRFRGFPVRIDMLSRFRSSSEARDVKQRLQAGELDILIGTHRLLGEVPFAKLGLLVVDEEQRFGVGQKERLTEARQDLHVLAMSATPVPRTLQLSLGGVRDVSLIETAPSDRMAVETAVVPFSASLVREAVGHEIERGGQVYYLYNRVEDIEDVARRLREWLPEIRLTVGHGQLPENELAKRMHGFQDGEYDVLLATTIIANGIDIPNVNTMLIQDAQRFGLAELYQLRGRVGRRERLGYCYLMVPPAKIVSEEARKRLTAIREFTELGAGFRIAARDLEIRGAGDILGAEQSGHIAAIGVDAYLKLLEQEVRSRQGEAVPEPVSTVLSLPGMEGIPEDYVGDAGLRLDLYQRLGDSNTDLDSLRAEVEDRFGSLPEAVEDLFAFADLRRKAEELRVQSITYRGRKLHVRFRTDAPVDVGSLVEWIDGDPGVTFSPTGVLTVDGVEASDATTATHAVLDRLGSA